MGRPYAQLRAGFPYYMTLGQRRVTSNAVDIAFGEEERVYVLCRGGLGTEIRCLNWDDDNLGTIGTGKFTWPSSLLCDKDENLYVSDEALNKVFVFDKDGEEIASLLRTLDGEVRFHPHPNLPPEGEGMFSPLWGRVRAGGEDYFSIQRS